ncbi:MAG: hypothetical protein NTW16_05330 [Bacteroidetes bacterium]|nr:hypothetical protein [Bacteroidota bacterium]
MSNTKFNALTRNYRGKFGDQFVLRNRRGKSIMAMLPKKSSAAPTDKQMAIRQRFRLASRYAKNALLNPDMLALYAAKSVDGMYPYLLAMTDYLKPPYVSEINASDYAGEPGNKIHVAADDDFAVTDVTVTIMDSAGNLIEKGSCVIDLVTGYYDYQATEAVADISGLQIIARAFDYPGHTGELSITL